ncbi:type I pantothenate kinase [Methylobacterium haplocladii]|uniref:Pantothenate kinase n=1 Tax=Methylobacterium haplocladii TaxID=1176176 RepID=A0A512IIW8_9HYPH|nr:type I pantothenate kinase [Methylobacterium haplocladii]GEO97631.1 pantothenate kinase [Methylobacterium haplocladii]GJD84494.1 Pantothenate kinase [Methylobacterium haplocladii]GLS57361.1 pantothenate kinase [Methylobacterium haplocladii]
MSGAPIPAIGVADAECQNPVTGEGPDRLSPYRLFTRAEWAQLRADTPLTLDVEDVARLQSINDPISIEEVVAIYLPLSRLLSLYVAATQGLFKATQRFLMAEREAKAPYIIGLAGSVAVGKSTTARVLKALLARWPNTPKVDLITTDGFLHPNAELKRMGAMERKGFPESYDTAALLRFLTDIKAGRKRVAAPVYSHLVYDVVPGEEQVIEQPDILIVEGLNVLQPARLPRDGTAIPFVSDFFDFSIYLDGHEDDLHRWYVNRFLRLRQTAFRNPLSYFRKYAEASETEALDIADGLWATINLPNLRDNILPTRQRASLILAKGASHRIESVALRRL